ncbi:MAG: hypothetical protein AAGK00_03370 [Pseudomonadota bacterium]
MKDRLTSLGSSIRGVLDSAWYQVPEFTLTSDVEIPIYLIHHGQGPEDYEIICDFADFMKANQKGFLSRPNLKVWAGRADFERSPFVRRLRHDFSQQFHGLRLALRAEREHKGWGLPSLGDILLWGLNASSEVIGAVLLWMATAWGRDLIKRISRIFQRSDFNRAVKSATAEQELEALIDEKKEVIDEGLARLEITLHRDLWSYAWRGQRPGPITGMDRQAWPLPDFVRERLRG